MATTTTTSPRPEKSGGGGNAPPPIAAILVVYIVLGVAISFFFGREPGTLPEDLVRELAPSVIVVCFFLTYYELCDVIGVGKAKGRFQKQAECYKEYSGLPIPEQVYLAQRAQTNQVEQMPVFLVGTFACAVLVSGAVAGVLALAWSLVRMGYATAYRNSVGKKHEEVMKRIAQYTIPAYFLSHSMLMAAGVHSVRCLLS